MKTWTSIVALVAAVQVGGFRSASDSPLRSQDGRAIVTWGPQVANPNPSSVQFTALADDGPEAVRGSHYRLTAASQPMKWPAESRLWMSWAAADAPGGARAGDLAVMRRTASAWVPLEKPETDGLHVSGGLHADGEYELRWLASHKCAGSSAHAMDFRLGAWDVRAAGYDPGRTDVSADPSGCAIFEHYLDVKGGRSEACFLLDAADVWYETVIDPSGRAILKGAVEPDGIAFYHSPTDREVYRRAPGGTIAFAGERSNDGGRTWTRWVASTYTRVAPR